VQPQIEEKYVQTGQVEIEMRPIAFIGQESVWAAEAAECANDQGRFLDYHDKLFEEQGSENSGAFSIDNLKSFAADLGLDTVAFDSCLDSHQYAQQVSLQTQEATNAGITSTPYFVVGGTTIAGLQSFDEFVRTIDDELKKAS
jgi:protein-disulfide isomerase